MDSKSRAKSHLRPQNVAATAASAKPLGSGADDDIVFDTNRVKPILKPNQPRVGHPASSSPQKSDMPSVPKPEEVRFNPIPNSSRPEENGPSVIELDSDDENRTPTFALPKILKNPEKSGTPEKPDKPEPSEPDDKLANEEPESCPFSKPKYPWDVFRKVAREQMLEQDDKPHVAAWVQVARFAIYVMLFSVVVGSVVTSRLTFLTLAGSWKGIISAEESMIEQFLDFHEGGRHEYQEYCHWLTLSAILTPTAIWFVFGVFRWAFSGNQTMPPIYVIIFIVGLEIAHSFGIVLFVNRVIVAGTNVWRLTSYSMAMSSLPSICGLVFVSDAYSCMISPVQQKILHKMAYFVALFVSIIPYIILAVASDWNEINSWELPTSLFLISFVYTLNFIFAEPLHFGSVRVPHWPAVMGDLYRVKAKMTVISCFTRLVCTLFADYALSNSPIWTMTFMSPLYSFLEANSSSSELPLDYESDGQFNIKINMTSKALDELSGNETESLLFGNYSLQHLIDSGLLNVTSFYLTHVVSTLVAYFASALACKLLMQQLAFALPLALATPLTVAVMLTRCTPQNADIPVIGRTLYWVSTLFNYPGRNNWYCLPEDTPDDMLWIYPTVLVLWYVGQNLAAFHSWFPNNERLAEVEKLFVLPSICSPFLEQWLLFNRRINDKLLLSGNESRKGANKEKPPVVPRVYACATMWHETRDEMVELMKSIFRMDKDHAERKRVLETLKAANDPEQLGGANEIMSQINYYEYETHIIFDDSWAPSEDGRGVVPNEFVRTMIEVLRDAGTSVYSRFFELPDPARYAAPYGGRLIWMLPGGTLLVVHMKDKNRMRHKKRWSQVMYMYYLLGYKLYCQDSLYRRRWKLGEAKRAKSMGEDEKIKLQLDKLDYPEVFRHVDENTAEMAENTFLLTLDGDVDFKASSVLLLLDLMKKSKKVGAACGRIHPIGTGPIVWYQKFEYAIAHWLQKAAEHVFGCVLCTPGCFSLFRGSALMDDNVMRTYATTSTEASHYVQYDQGEDRWLCTLMLQQGYRAEYSAAADALTHCPEGFNEFYQQRRRWGPSTLSNIIDLLSSWKQTVIMNDNFSLPYVAYQFMLLISTLLGPATIIMMIAGAYNAVFHIDLVQSYILSLAPPAFFVAICFSCKTDTQINVAAVMSAIYAIIMLVVVVGTIINGLQESLTSPNVIFVFALIAIFITSASCHPREFTDLTHGWLYVLCIPAGYLLLTIYSLANMNNVSWGTRETPAPVSQDEDAKKAAEEEAKKKKEAAKANSFLAKIGVTQAMGDMKDFLRGLANREQNAGHTSSDAGSDSLPLLKEIRDLLQVMTLKKIQGEDGAHSMAERPSSHSQMAGIPAQPGVPEIVVAPPVKEEPKKPKPEQPAIDYEYWLRSNVVGNGPVRNLEQDEVDFWKQLISRYAYPLPDDKLKKEKIAAELKVLRNNVVFAVSMMNFLWIVITFQLQYHQDLLKYAIFVPIPRGDDNTRLEYFEPLGMIFLLFFAIILVVQYSGMLAHRLDTFLHLIAAADIEFGLTRCCRERNVNVGDYPTLGSLGDSQFQMNSFAKRRPSRNARDMARVVNPRYIEDASQGLLSRRNRPDGGSRAAYA